MSTEDNVIPDVMAPAAVIAYADVGDRAAAIEPTCVSEREPGSEMDTAPDGSINATANASSAFVRDGQSQDIATLADAVFQAKYPAPGARPGEMALFTGSYAKMLTPPEKPECDRDTGSHGPWLIKEIGDEFSSVEKYSPSLAAPKNATCTTCGAQANYMALLRSWAIENLSDSVRDELNGGNVLFEDVDLDPTGVALLGVPTVSQRQTMAALTLLGIEFLEHAHGHKPKCFKSSKKKGGRRCRQVSHVSRTLYFLAAALTRRMG
jgi:hypothetical protein